MGRAVRGISRREGIEGSSKGRRVGIYRWVYVDKEDDGKWGLRKDISLYIPSLISLSTSTTIPYPIYSCSLSTSRLSYGYP